MRMAIVAAPLLLTGCMPPALALASYLADGAVFAATGRTSADHGLSAMTGEDCMVFRAIDGQSVCVAEKPPVVSVPAPAPAAPVVLVSTAK
jgi:hypothetical protein